MTFDLVLHQANKLHENDKFKEAENLYRDVLKAQPKHLDALNNLGLVLLQLGKIDEAEISCRKAIEINFHFVEAHFNLGNILYTLKKFDEAELCYKKTIELKIDHDKAHNNLGIVLNQLNRLKEAIISFKKAIALNPASNEFHKNLDETVSQYELSLIAQKMDNSKKNNVPLLFNSLISNRIVEEELIPQLYKIDSIEIGNPKDVRYGNGRCSNDLLFKNGSSILKKVEKDLIDIIKKTTKSEIYILESFFNILNSGSGTIKHHHISSFDKKNGLVNRKYSLTYYVSIGDQNCKDPGILKLHNPEEEILPTNGMIIIIPATRLHSVIYGGKTDRVMIGVNFYTVDK